MNWLGIVIMLAVFLCLVPLIRWLYKKYSRNLKNIFRILKGRKTFTIIFIVIFVLVSAGIGGWLYYSAQQAKTPEKQYEKEFIEGVLPNVKEVASLDTFLADIFGKKIEKAYRQYSPKESTTLIKYFVKLRGVDGYYEVYVPYGTTVGMGVPIDVYMAGAGTPLYVMSTEPSVPGARQQYIIVAMILVGFAIIFFFLFRRQFSGKFLKHKGRELESKVTFADVGGIDEAKEEVAEVVTVLGDPGPYLELNARVPHGILLLGPPGTGKTLLARAVAGEAGVHVEEISGSEFHEMFIGVGASRARDFFDKLEKSAPSVGIVDELDSAVPRRGADISSHQENVNLVNQFLTRLDRIEKENIPVFVIGITNRPDMLDPAAIRSGRFDRHVEIGPPQADGRKAILKIHLTKPKIRPVDFNIDDGDEINDVVKETEGFTGADLATLANEAAIRAVREKRKIITLEDFRQSIERVLMGPVKKLKQSDKEKELVAWHEAGHALTALLLPETDPVHFITILPHGRSLGYTRLLPETEYHVVGETRVFNQIKYAMGGRAAEEIRFEKRSTGARQDIAVATSIARTAVCAYGMSDLGPISISDPINEYWLPQLWSEKMKEEVDGAVRSLLEDCYQEALRLLTENKPTLERLARKLIANKRLVRPEIEEITGIKKGTSKDGF